MIFNEIVNFWKHANSYQKAGMIAFSIGIGTTYFGTMMYSYGQLLSGYDIGLKHGLRIQTVGSEIAK